MLHERTIRPTLHAVEMDLQDELVVRWADGRSQRLRLIGTGAAIVSTTLDAGELPLRERKGAVTIVRFWCDIEHDGATRRLERIIGTQDSFYEPWRIGDLHLWFDACDDIFAILQDAHGGCRPQKRARFALQDAACSIAPEPLHPWCPLPHGRVRIEDAYTGEDCWMGAYFGASAHGGLDINHPPGTPIWAPVGFDDHDFFDATHRGHTNNRHRALHHWSDGSTWVLQCHHMTRLVVPPHTPVAKGQCYASGAGVLSGAAHHSHFCFRIRDVYGESRLDPWIVFWQILRDGLPEPASRP